MHDLCAVKVSTGSCTVGLRNCKQLESGADTALSDVTLQLCLHIQERHVLFVTRQQQSDMLIGKG